MRQPRRGRCDVVCLGESPICGSTSIGAFFQRTVGDLVANALTHTPYQQPRKHRSPWRAIRALPVAVRDTGRGIPPRAPAACVRSFLPRGSLAINDVWRTRARLASGPEHHEVAPGSVDIESRPGSGTCVYLRFPAHPCLNALGGRV